VADVIVVKNEARTRDGIGVTVPNPESGNIEANVVKGVSGNGARGREVAALC